MKRSFASDTLSQLFHSLEIAEQENRQPFLAATLPLRQPVHTVYGGAHLFSSDTPQKIARLALQAFKDYAPDPDTFMQAMGVNTPQKKRVSEALAKKVFDRVQSKLSSEAVEDYRIDFEDGYGIRSDSEEDHHAEQAALELAKGMKQGSLPPFLGVRIKSFSLATYFRATRTLDLVISNLVQQTGGRLPNGFVVTLPKVTHTSHIQTLVELLSILEKQHRLAPQSLKFEFMVETTQAILAQDGRVPLREFVRAGQGRCVAAHFGTYDYTADCGLIAEAQKMTSATCDFAKQVMLVALAGSPVFLSDGATTRMPIAPHRTKEGGALSPAQLEENRNQIAEAWQESYHNIRHSLANGFYQGWDLHPAQLPVRYGATYLFFLESFSTTAERLRSFIEKAARASRLGNIFDDAASGQGLLNFFLRGLACGAVLPEELSAIGLSSEEIQTRSFMKILEGRKTESL